MGGGWLNAVVALALVIGLIYLLAWLLRRMPSQRLHHGSNLRMIASLALGQKERLMLVEVNGSQLLLGITPNNISLLYSFENRTESCKEFPA